jgi:predicted ATPase
MLTEFRLQNFKTWKDTEALRLAPITVFFGGNSSGKSSIGQFLLTLRRTVEQPDRSLVLHTSDDRNPVDLGSYFAYVHANDEASDISFSLRWSCAQPVMVGDPLGTRKLEAQTMGFDAAVGVAIEGGAPVSKHFTYRMNPGKVRGEAAFMYARETSGKYKLDCQGFKAVRKQMRGWPLTPPTRCYGFPEELYAYYQNVGDLAELQLELERQLRSLHYLGPLREYPRRDYSWSGQTPSDAGFQGENTIPALLGGGERKFSGGTWKRYQPLQVAVGAWLQRMGIVEGFRLERVSRHTRSYQVRLKMRGRKAEVALPDVGFGVSQVLPVIVQAFYAPPNSTVIIEQPEIHLHPAIQSELADLFIEAIRSKEEHVGERRVQFLIESHSEHFLRRLQRRVAEGLISTEDVAVYFCEAPDKLDHSTIRPLALDEFGTISNWPKHFFGDQMTDIAEARKAGLRRKIGAGVASQDSVKTPLA